MLNCFTLLLLLSLLLLLLLLSLIIVIAIIIIIIIIIIIFIISTVNTIWRKKQQWGERVALLTVCTCLYTCYLCTNFYF